MKYISLLKIFNNEESTVFNRHFSRVDETTFYQTPVFQIADDGTVEMSQAYKDCYGLSTYPRPGMFRIIRPRLGIEIPKIIELEFLYHDLTEEEIMALTQMAYALLAVLEIERQRFQSHKSTNITEYYEHKNQVFDLEPDETEAQMREILSSLTDLGVRNSYGPKYTCVLPNVIPDRCVELLFTLSNHSDTSKRPNACLSIMLQTLIPLLVADTFEHKLSDNSILMLKNTIQFLMDLSPDNFQVYPDCSYGLYYHQPHGEITFLEYDRNLLLKALNAIYNRNTAERHIVLSDKRLVPEGFDTPFYIQFTRQRLSWETGTNETVN